MKKFFLMFICLLAAQKVSAADLFVSMSGSDSNSGASTAPLRTIQKAANLAKAGTTVYVAPGTYAESIYSSASGTATARIRYVSTSKWGAKIVPASSGASTAWDNRGSYVEIEGFDVDGQSKSTWVSGLYAGGSYNVIKNNHVHHIGMASTCSNNGGAGIGTDHYYYGVNSDVIGNVVHHIGTTTCNYIQGLYISTTGQVKNNLVYQVGAAAIHLWHDARSITIANNTVFASGYGVIVGSGDTYHYSGSADNVHVSNNIIFDNGIGVSEQGNTGRNNTYTNNLVFNNLRSNWSLQNGLTHTGTVAADPQFVNYIRTGGGDYHLKSTSPAIDRGSGTYAPTTDLDGRPRPQGAAIDIGSYEYGSTGSAPAPTPAPPMSPTISLSTTSVAPGGTLIVKVSGMGTSTADWAALYLASAADSNWSYQANWMYLNGTKTQPSGLISSATLTFVAPRDPGTYDIRLFAGAGYANRVAVSAKITVTAGSTTDTTVPVTSVTSPSSTSIVTRGSKITATASASDNTGVAKVDFYVNDVLACTDAVAPYNCAFTISGRRGVIYQIQSYAYDSAGNVGAASIVSVTSSQ